jgi:hypothetical protein
MMNERIKELLDKAMVAGQEGLGGYHWELDEEKFAELIVNECLSIIRDKVTLEVNEDYREGFHRAQQFLHQDIVKHFGVK